MGTPVVNPDPMSTPGGSSWHLFAPSPPESDGTYQGDICFWCGQNRQAHIPEYSSGKGAVD